MTRRKLAWIFGTAAYGLLSSLPEDDRWIYCIVGAFVGLIFGQVDAFTLSRRPKNWVVPKDPFAWVLFAIVSTLSILYFGYKTINLASPNILETISTLTLVILPCCYIGFASFYFYYTLKSVYFSVLRSRGKSVDEPLSQSFHRVFVCFYIGLVVILIFVGDWLFPESALGEAIMVVVVCSGVAWGHWALLKIYPSLSADDSNDKSSAE